MSRVMKIVLIVLLVIVLAVVGVGVYVLTNMRADAVETVEKPDDLTATEEPATVMVAIPPVAMFFLMQRHFIAGLTMGAVKG